MLNKHTDCTSAFQCSFTQLHYILCSKSSFTEVKMMPSLPSSPAFNIYLELHVWTVNEYSLKIDNINDWKVKFFRQFFHHFCYCICICIYLVKLCEGKMVEGCNVEKWLDIFVLEYKWLNDLSSTYLFLSDIPLNLTSWK